MSTFRAVGEIERDVCFSGEGGGVKDMEGWMKES